MHWRVKRFGVTDKIFCTSGTILEKSLSMLVLKLLLTMT